MCTFSSCLLIPYIFYSLFFCDLNGRLWSINVDCMLWMMQDWEQINLNNGPHLDDCQWNSGRWWHSTKQWGAILNVCRDLPLNIHAVFLSRMCQSFCEKTKISIRNSILISLSGPSDQLPSPQSKGDLLLSLSHFSSCLLHTLTLAWISCAPSDID